MSVLISAFYLALVHIAGDNIGVIPDMAALIGTDIYVNTILVYFIFGTFLTAILSWIGVYTGKELAFVVGGLLGCTGKKLLAIITLAICLPASALTGGYFAGKVLSYLTGLPECATAFICLAVFCMLAAGYGDELLKVSNYISILLIPMVLFSVLFSPHDLLSFKLTITKIDWLLVFALIGYNMGGMRSVLVVEAAAYLTKRGKRVVYLSILAKIFEGFFTLLMAHSVILAGASGPLALAEVFHYTLGNNGVYLFYIVVLCTFTNTMAPAMMVNAHQISVITGFTFWSSIIAASIITYIGSMFGFTNILIFMSVTGFIMVLFIFCIAFCFYRSIHMGIN